MKIWNSFQGDVQAILNSEGDAKKKQVEIYKLCDKVRDSTLFQQGIKIEDQEEVVDIAMIGLHLEVVWARLSGTLEPVEDLVCGGKKAEGARRERSFVSINEGGSEDDVHRIDREILAVW